MLLDKLLPKMSDVQRGNLPEVLQKATFIRLQNVADYYWEESYQDEWDSKDFPNCTPPWPLVWAEWKQPEFSNSPRYGKRRHGLAHRGICAMVESHDAGANEQGTFRWIVRVTGIIEAPELATTDGSPIVMCTEFLMVQSDGTLFLPYVDDLPKEWMRTFLQCVSGSTEWDLGGDHKGYRFVPSVTNLADSQLGANLFQHLARNIVLLAFSFCHCKNVNLTEHTYDDKLLQSRERKDKPTFSKFYTLEIRPMQKVIKNTMQSRGVSFPAALHIMRGHFKDYRQGGLFGKHRGTYWWNMAIRGKAERGQVVKDYTVTKPVG